MNTRFPAMARDAWIAVALAFVIGLAIGWFLLGWVAFPVTWTNADPWDLNPQAKATYVTMVADSFGVSRNLTVARERLRGFTKDEVSKILGDEIQVRNRAGQANQAAALSQFATAYGVNISGTGSTTAPSATPAPGGTGSGGGLGSLLGSLGPMLLLLLLLIVLIAVGLFGYTRLRGRPATPRVARTPAPSTRLEDISVAGPAGGPMAAAMSGGPAPRAAPQPAPMPAGRPLTAPTSAAVASTKNLGTFAATYKFGDDNYDTAFTLETAKGEFLGETGMGISETIGEGKPDKVTAFDLWLFDKTDVRTVTQILMSEHAFNDQALRARLAQKGELTLAEKGKHILLETQTLRVDATIVDLVYASTPGLASNSHFQKLIIEMVPVQK